MDRLERLSAVAQERRALVAVARAEGLNAEESLECVQDALITFLGVERVEENEHPLATIKIIVRNAARNHRRLHRRALPHEPFDEETNASGDVDAEHLLAHAEEVVRLRLCVSSLCGVQRAVITLRLLEERSGEDVAEALGLTRGHVDVLVHRAKAALRVCMTHQS